MLHGAIVAGTIHVAMLVCALVMRAGCLPTRVNAMASVGAGGRLVYLSMLSYGTFAVAFVAWSSMQPRVTWAFYALAVVVSFAWLFISASIAGGATLTCLIGDPKENHLSRLCLLYTSPSPRDGLLSRMPSSA